MPNQRQSSMPRNRILGARLRAIRRVRTGLTLEGAADALGWSLTTMCRIENGQRQITTEEIASVLTAYGIPAPERRVLIANAKAENCSAWWDEPLPGIPSDQGTLASYLNDATRLTDWATAVIPGLLQTEDYAFALLRSSGLDPATAHHHWTARHVQQKILGTLDYTAYIAETALRTAFGGTAAHLAQLQHLISARDRGIPIRIVPAHHPTGLIAHSWLHMTFPNTTPVVTITTTYGNAYLHNDQATPYIRALTTLNHTAFAVHDSQKLLHHIRNQINNAA